MSPPCPERKAQWTEPPPRLREPFFSREAGSLRLAWGLVPGQSSTPPPVSRHKSHWKASRVPIHPKHDVEQAGVDDPEAAPNVSNQSTNGLALPLTARQLRLQGGLLRPVLPDYKPHCGLHWPGSHTANKGLGLALTIGFVTVTTGRASAASIPGVNKDHRDTRTSGFAYGQDRFCSQPYDDNSYKGRQDYQ